MPEKYSVSIQNDISMYNEQNLPFDILFIKHASFYLSCTVHKILDKRTFLTNYYQNLLTVEYFLNFSVRFVYPVAIVFV